MSFWGLPGGRRAFSPRGAAGGGAGRGGEPQRAGGAAGERTAQERGRERAAGGAAGARTAQEHGRGAGRGGGAAGARTAEERGRGAGRGGAGEQGAAGGAALSLGGRCRPPWESQAARAGARMVRPGRPHRRPPAPALGKKRRMQDYAVFCAACPPARTSYAQRQPPKKQGIVDNVVDNVDKSAARMWKNGLHTRPPRMHFPSPFAFLARKKSGRPKPQTGYFSF